MDTYIDIATHIAASLLIALVLWSYYGNPKKKLFLVCSISLIAGLLIDIDHLFDYVLAFGWNFDFSKFMKGDSFTHTHKIYVLFHAFEYVGLLTLWAFVTKNKLRKLLLI